MTSSVRVLLNSAVAFACAVYLCVTAHEFAHALAGLALHLQATVYPNHVDFSPTTNSQAIIIALAGPFFSLVSGLIVLALLPRSWGFGQLLWLWFGLISVQTFTGYLMTGPFFRGGDIGQALALLGAPLWVAWLGFVIGAAGTFLLGRVATQHFMTFTNPAHGSLAPQLRQVGLFAWLVGIVLSVLGGSIVDQLSQTGIFEFLGVLTSGLFVLLVRFYMSRLPSAEHRDLTLGLPWAGLGLFVIVALFRFFVLKPGLHLG